MTPEPTESTRPILEHAVVLGGQRLGQNRLELRAWFHPGGDQVVPGERPLYRAFGDAGIRGNIRPLNGRWST